MKEIYKSIKHKIIGQIYQISIKGIRKTRPIEYRLDNSVVIFSLINTDNVDMYLVAIKSFMYNFGYGRVEVLIDGKLTNSQIELLNFHIPHLVMSQADLVDTKGCPSYSSWKRLFKVVELSKDAYVIQLDSDTISCKPHSEVHLAVKKQQAFLTSEPCWAKAVDTQFLQDIVQQWKNPHVQTRAESHFDEIAFYAENRSYLRGCAGFAGYPKNFASIKKIKEFSEQIENFIGPTWKKWGSEQTTTCSLLSQTLNPISLTWPYYQNYGFPESNEKLESMSLIHFIGSNRFNDFNYILLSRRFIKAQLN